MDKIFSYGCDVVFSEVALAVCQQEEIELRYNGLDTTSFSLSGESVPEAEEHAIWVTHGYSQEHRPAWK